MKRILFICAIALALCSSAFGQVSPKAVFGTLTNHATVTGCGQSKDGADTTGACVAAQLPQNSGSFSIQVLGTFTGTVQFEVSNDGINFYNQTGYPTPTGAAVSDTVNTAGLWRFQAGAYSWVRARASALTGGTPAIRIYTSAAPITY